MARQKNLSRYVVTGNFHVMIMKLIFRWIQVCWNFKSSEWHFLLHFRKTIQYLLDNHLVDVTSIILSEGTPQVRSGRNQTHSLRVDEDGTLHSNYVQNRFVNKQLCLALIWISKSYKNSPLKTLLHNSWPVVPDCKYTHTVCFIWQLYIFLAYHALCSRNFKDVI